MTLRFLRHFAEMLVAMYVGMLVLGPLWPIPTDRADVASFVMATDMSLAMAVWMWHRSHDRLAIGEMTAAMYAPFAVLLLPWYAGLWSSGIVLVGGHVLGILAMAAVVLRHPTGSAGPRTGPLTRWPTALALLATVDNVVDPRPLPAWSLVVLAVSYLLIGLLRRTLRPARVLRRQLAAAGFYLTLIAVALLAPGDVGLWVVGTGWLAHAGWDWWHHHHDAVVPRPFAEWCGVVDAVIGISVLVSVAL
ncbi:hypothetical protein [Cryptosporangium phraense]|uniref:hypothetical protein n=1 Tax=Cryptosporangium phraense TaxID=2593070 RepID=UPI00197AFACB|nr:hypothetical protein [Cryptosporangium phraense]